LDEEHGELYCSGCGLVVEEGIVKTSVGPPRTYWIYDKDPSTQASLRRLSASERNLIHALAEINRMSYKLGLPEDVRETAAMLYCKARALGLIRGRSIEGLATAALYIACRLQGILRTLNEVTEVSWASWREISRSYRFLLRELDLKLPPVSPTDFVPRFCLKLGLDREVEAKAIEIIKEAEKKEITEGKDPLGIAAAAIYIAAFLCNKDKTLEEVSEVTGVSEFGIRNRTRELVEELLICPRTPPVAGEQ